MNHPLEVLDAMREKVLIVEDDALIALSMREILTLVGFEVAGVAATVSDALILAENTRPDLAIFDVRLAGRRDGIEGAMLLRGIMEIPVLFLTAQGDEGTRARAAALNPAAYLYKPVHAQEIIAAVENALTRSAPLEHAAAD
jgi:DNA-binding response OmpR family regulator